MIFAELGTHHVKLPTSICLINIELLLHVDFCYLKAILKYINQIPVNQQNQMLLTVTGNITWSFIFCNAYLMENAYRVLREKTESWAYNYNPNLLTTVSGSPFSLSSLRKLADIHKCINTSLLLFFPLQKRHIHLKGWSMPSKQNRGCPSRQRTFLRAGIRSAWQNLTSPESPFLIICGVEEALSPSPSSYLLRKEHFHFCFWWYGNQTSGGFGLWFSIRNTAYLRKCISSQSRIWTALFFRVQHE